MELPQLSATGWTIVVIAATSAALGLGSRMDVTDRAKDYLAMGAYICSGLALILTQV